jgi:hypothetical protein
LDIGLHQDYQPLNLPHRPKPKALGPQDRRERERAFLGCYYLSSMHVPIVIHPFLHANTIQDRGWTPETKFTQAYTVHDRLGTEPKERTRV